jgi:hypothetical protein
LPKKNYSQLADETRKALIYACRFSEDLLWLKPAKSTGKTTLAMATQREHIISTISRKKFKRSILIISILSSKFKFKRLMLVIQNKCSNNFEEFLLTRYTEVITRPYVLSPYAYSNNAVYKNNVPSMSRQTSFSSVRRPMKVEPGKIGQEATGDERM